MKNGCQNRVSEMYWNDDEDLPVEPQSDVVDVVFVIKGKTLPNNALSAIAQSLSEQIQDWDKLSKLALHLKLGGEEGNGWYRDKDPDSVLYLSRRTKLILRVPQEDVDNIQSLTGVELDVQGHSVKLTHKLNKSLTHSPTLYSHHVISEFEEEVDFLRHVQEQLQELNIKCKKILCGKLREIEVANQKVNTRSLMLNELNKEDSLLLQAKGIGSQQKRGCGVFVPYKTIS